MRSEESARHIPVNICCSNHGEKVSHHPYHVLQVDEGYEKTHFYAYGSRFSLVFPVTEMPNPLFNHISIQFTNIPLRF